MPSRAQTSRETSRTPLFELRWEFVLILVAMALIMFALTRTARAETTEPTKTKTVKKHTTTIVDKDEDVDSEDSTGDHPTSAEAQREKVMTAKFGSRNASGASSGMAGCRTEELSKSAIRGLKSDCDAWLKDRRTELKGKYLTGTCEETCEDCGMNLERCSVTGSVHYTTATVK